MKYTKQRMIFDRAVGDNQRTPMSDLVAIGTVIDTNDPMQLGRIRAVVPSWGDSWEHNINVMPWCMYVTPFGGQVATGTRGPELSESEGGISYGMWAIPKVGAQVVVMSLDEQHINRIYIGCVYTPTTTHSMPHGRWISEDHPELEKVKTKGKPYGPYTSREKFVEPYAKNVQKAFDRNPRTNDQGKDKPIYEWKTRAADYSVSRVDVSQLSVSLSKVQDDQETKLDGWSSTQGYQNSRIDPHGNEAGKNYDSLVYAWTTPGFHAISMDDKQENCRIRLRTSSGHQIIMDDTNERIYISTAEGNNWIEMDQAGNIDVFTTGKLSVRAKQDINFTSDKTIRMFAKEGIHMHSDDEIRMTAKKDIHVLTDQNLRLHTKQKTIVEADKELSLKTDSKLLLQSKSSTSVKSSSTLNLQSKSTTNVKAGGNIVLTGKKIHLNGPGAADADEALSPEEKPAHFTHRVPDKEPWGRVMTKRDDTHDPELEYDDKKVGKHERGKTIMRGPFWRR